MPSNGPLPHQRHLDGEGVAGMVEATAAHIAMANRFITEHGEEAFGLAMQHGGDLFGAIRNKSRAALDLGCRAKHAGLQATLMIKWNPDAKKAGEQTEIRVVTGDADKIHLSFGQVEV